MGGPVSVHDTRHHAALDRPARPAGDFRHGRRRRGRPSFPYRWQDDYHARVGLLPRDGDATDVVWHDVEPCYVFHPMNAYDEPAGDGIVLDVVRHPSMFRTSAPRTGRGRADARALAHRRPRRRRSRRSGWTTGARSFHASTSAESACPHRYGYASPWASGTTRRDRVESSCGTTSSGAPAVTVVRSAAPLSARPSSSRAHDAGDEDGRVAHDPRLRT